MRIARGLDGALYVVFSSDIAAERMRWLFWSILRRRVACFGQYDNAYRLF